MAVDPLVLQMVRPKINGHERPASSGQIVPMSRARARIAANHTAALGLGYSSTLDPDNDFVRYTATIGSRTVTIQQWFANIGKMFQVPRHPMTGPPPNYAPITGPTVGVGTEIIAIFGQSNADFSGTGRYQAAGLTYALGQDGNWYICADPLGRGTGLGGSDAGPWARLADLAMGKVNPVNGATINRVIMVSRAVGGSDIAYWARLDEFLTASTTSLTIGTGAKTFTIGSNFYRNGMGLIATGPGGVTMQGIVTAHTSTSVTVQVSTTSGTGTFASWTLRPPFAGDGNAYMRAQLNDLLGRGIPPLKVVFAQGEADVGSALSDTEYNAIRDYWQHGFIGFNQGMRTNPLDSLSLTPLFVPHTVMCNLRDPGTTGATLDAIIDRSPDTYVGMELGREAVREAQDAVINGVNVLAGPNLDWLGPELRRDGCHISDQGLDEAAKRWSVAIYGS